MILSRKFDERLREIERHQAECDAMHQRHIEHNLRNESAANNLTESNILLAKSINELSITMSRVLSTIENDQPVIKTWRDIITAWSVNKKIFLTIVALSSGVVAIISLVKYFY